MERRISVWVAGTYTLLAAIVVADYALRYGPEHFLWLSDVALIVLVPALWLESRRLVSMMATAVLALELAWVLLFVWGLLTGHAPLGMAAYMLDPTVPVRVRVISGAFHIVLPAVMIYALMRLGYDRRALWLQVPVTWIVQVASWLLSSVGDNVNYVHGFGEIGPLVPQPGHLLVMMVALPLLGHLPTHLVLARVCRSRTA